MKSPLFTPCSVERKFSILSVKYKHISILEKSTFTLCSVDISTLYLLNDDGDIIKGFWV